MSIEYQRSFRNSSIDNPALRIMEPSVNALIGLWRGMVMILSPSVIVVCFPCRAIQKPAFLKALIASWCGMSAVLALCDFGYFDITRFYSYTQLSLNFEIIMYCILDVFQSLLFSCAL